MNSKQKGSLAVAQCISKMYEKGFEVLLPLGDRKPYDLVLDDGTVLRKVQCKYAGLGSNGKYKAQLRITGGNQSFHSARKYGDKDFDLLYVYTEDGNHYLLTWDEVTNRNTIDIKSPKYEKDKI